MSEAVLNRFPKEISGNQIDVIDVEELSQSTFIEKYVNNNTPCLIKNAIKHWPAINKWNKQQYLTDLVGKYELDVYSIRNHINFKTMKDNGKKLTFSEGLKLAHQEGDSVVSMPANTIDGSGQFKELLGDIGHFTFLEKQPEPIIYDRDRFFAYKGAGTGWHQHPHDETLMCQVVGSKKVALLCSCYADSALLDSAFNTDNVTEYNSLLEKNAENLSLVIVEEGDALYLPPYWFHGIDPVDHNFGVTLAHCWKSKIYKFGEMKYSSNRANLLGVFKCLPYLPNYYTLLLFSLCLRGVLLIKIKRMMKMFGK